MKKKKGSKNNRPKQQDKYFYDVKKYQEDKLDEIANRINHIQTDFANYKQYTAIKFQLVFVYLQGIANLVR